jgi:hypothetical protein
MNNSNIENNKNIFFILSTVFIELYLNLRLSTFVSKILKLNKLAQIKAFMNKGN